MKNFALIGATLAILTAAPVSAASFIGDTFEGSYRFPSEGRETINAGTGTVSPVAQFTFPTGRINPTASVSASSITVTFAGSGRYNSAEFNGILLRNISKSVISGFALDPGTTVFGFDQSRLTFNSNTLFMNFQGLDIRSTDRITANVTFMSSPVPEPSTWLFMILGLGLVGYTMRFTKARQSRAISFA